MEEKIAAKDTLITELNERLTKLEEHTDDRTQVKETKSDGTAAPAEDILSRMLFNYKSGRNQRINITKKHGI